MSKTQKRYLGTKNLDLETITLLQYREKVSEFLPRFISESLDDLTEIELIREGLEVFFREEDLIEAAAVFQPLIAFREESPKHVQFQAFTTRIQMMFGSNKSGKSGNGGAKCAKIALGLNPQFPWKPEPGRILRGWICNTTRAKIDDSTYLELKKWLRPDQFSEKKGNNGKPEKIIITSDNGGVCEIELKPYEAGVKEFESANIDFIWCDEPPPQPILEAMWGRLVQYSGWLMITATTVQPDSKYLRELADGEGPLARLAREVEIDALELNMWDNKLLSRKQINEFVAMYPEGTPMYKIRVLGQYADSEGLVFPNFITHIDNGFTRQPWNAYNPLHFTEEMMRKSVHIAHADYGQDEPFTYLDGWISQDQEGQVIDYTWRIHAELYQAGLQARDQGKLIAQRIAQYGTPTMLFADKQILRQQAQGAPIWNLWQEEIVSAGQTPPAVRAQEIDKRDPTTGLANLADWTARINKVTGLPCLIISTNCPNTLREFSSLLWKPASPYSNSAGGVTKGKDHSVDPCRYTVQSGLLRDGLIYKHHAPTRAKVKLEPAFY